MIRQLTAVIWACSRSSSARSSCFHHLVDEAGGGRGRPGSWQRQAARPRARAMWVLPGYSLLPSAMMFSRATTYSQRASSRTSGLNNVGMAGEVEGPRALTAGTVRHGSVVPNSCGARGRSGRVPPDAVAVAGMSERGASSSRATFGGQQEGRQLQLLQVVCEQHLRRAVVLLRRSALGWLLSSTAFLRNGPSALQGNAVGAGGIG